MLAEVLEVNQPAIAKMEKRADAYTSTLRSHIEAMGGEVEITARFSEGSVKSLVFLDWIDLWRFNPQTKTLIQL